MSTAALRIRQPLLAVAGVLAALALVLLVRQSQTYTSDYQSFPLVDWIEFTFGPNDAAAFGTANQMAKAVLPVLERFSLSGTADGVPVVFASPQFERQLSGLDTAHGLRLTSNEGASNRTSGALEIRVFKNRWRAQTYMGLSAFDVNRRPDMMEVTPRRALDGERVWLMLDDSSKPPAAEAIVIGQIGPAFYQVAIHSEHTAPNTPAGTAALFDRSQATAEEIASAWRTLMRAHWTEG